MLTQFFRLGLCILATLGAVRAQIPTISGTAAFWYLGGVTSDNGYDAYTVLTANPNGNPGTDSWSVSQTCTTGHGCVTLNCTSSCGGSVTATSTSANAGCASDVTITVTYGINASAPYGLTIVAPSTTTLESNYPMDTGQGTNNPGSGYISTYQWDLRDTCGFVDSGLDQNETFGTWTQDYGGTIDWFHPNPDHLTDMSYVVVDTVDKNGGNTPVSTWPGPMQIPPIALSSTTVFHNTPWNLLVGSLTSGTGIVVHSDLQQWYTDHGRHQ